MADQTYNPTPDIPTESMQARAKPSPAIQPATLTQTLPAIRGGSLPVPLRKVRSAFRLARSHALQTRNRVMASDYFDTVRHELSGNVPGPVFIVGNGRSGTSVLLGAVRKTLNWKAYGEGHVHPLAFELSDVAERYFVAQRAATRNRSHMIYKVDQAQFQSAILNVFRNTYLDTFGTERFVDKTPGAQAIRALPLLQTVFPDMRVIFAKRRAIEVIRSAHLKFPETVFEDHALTWKETMRTWEVVRERLAVPYVEIDQYDLKTVPELAVHSLTTLLKLTPAQARNLTIYLATDRPQSSGPLNRGAVSLDESGWTPEQKHWFTDNLGSVMADYGWVETERYFADHSADGSDIRANPA